MKNFPGFKVTLNNKLITTAGINTNNFGATICIIDSVKRQVDNSEHLKLTITGINASNDMLTWCKQDLELGDTIELEVVKAPFNAPIEVKKSHKTDAEILEQKLKQFYKLKEELKDYL